MMAGTANTHETKAQLEAHNRRPGVPKANDSRKWRAIRRRVRRWIRELREEWRS